MKGKHEVVSCKLPCNKVTERRKRLEMIMGTVCVSAHRYSSSAVHPSSCGYNFKMGADASTLSLIKRSFSINEVQYVYIFMYGFMLL